MADPHQPAREDGEHERATRLLNAVFAFDPPLTTADLRWYYDENPAGPAAVGRVERADTDEGLARTGNYALVPFPLERADGVRLTLGVGVDLAVDPTARGKGTFRATVEDAYARGSTSGLDGILGVANANSAPRMVSSLGWRALPDLPTRLLVAGFGGGRYRSTVVDPVFLASDAFVAAVGDGFAPQAGAGFAPQWDGDRLRWRLGKRRARYWLHDGDDVLAVSTVTKLRGVRFAVLVKTLPRRPGRPVDGGALVRHLMRTHRTPFVVHFGRTPQVRLRGVTLPRRLLPSPLALVLHPFTERLDREAFRLDAFEFLDFDAY